MKNPLRNEKTVSIRHLRNFIRQPWFVAITLVQPVIWLLLFGALFKKTTQIPGFGEHSYIKYLTPGVVVMTAVFSSGWAGMATIDDINRGVLNRFLVTPIRRSSYISGALLSGSVSILIQSFIILLLGVLAGATIDNPLTSIPVMVFFAAVLGMGFGAFSHGLALHARQEETLIGAVTFLTLPLTFMSTVFMPAKLAPHWIEVAGQFNPVNWAVVASREATSASVDWGVVASRGGLLLGFAFLMLTFATKALATYQRTA